MGKGIVTSFAVMNVQDGFIRVPGVTQCQGAPTRKLFIQAQDNRSAALTDVVLGSLRIGVNR